MQVAGAVKGIQVEPAVVPRNGSLVDLHAFERFEFDQIAVVVLDRAGPAAVLVENFVDGVLRHTPQHVQGHPTDDAVIRLGLDVGIERLAVIEAEE